jgi:hypothetical protein
MHLHLTPTALAKAKALGIVTAALAAGGTGGMVALSQVSNSSDTAVTVSADATATPTESPTVSPTDSPTATPDVTATDAAAPVPTSTAYVLPSCPADVKNHGAYVSSVAKGAPKGAHGEHGGWVRQAAQSDCGKPTPGATDSADTQDTPDAQDTPESEAPHTSAPKTDKTQGGHGHGHHDG